MPSSLKVVFVGDSKVGKTSLLYQKEEEYPPTLFIADHKSVTFEGKTYQLNLFEGSASEAHTTLRPFTCENGNVFICTFSIGHPESFANIEEEWVPEVRSYIPNVPKTMVENDIPIILLGLKADLRDDKEHVEKLALLQQKPITFAQGTNLANKLGCVKYHECSTKLNIGIDELFENIIVRAAQREWKSNKLKDDSNLSRKRRIQ